MFVPCVVIGKQEEDQNSKVSTSIENLGTVTVMREVVDYLVDQISRIIVDSCLFPTEQAVCGNSLVAIQFAYCSTSKCKQLQVYSKLLGIPATSLLFHRVFRGVSNMNLHYVYSITGLSWWADPARKQNSQAMLT